MHVPPELMMRAVFYGPMGRPGVCQYTDAPSTSDFGFELSVAAGEPRPDHALTV
jgi:hypothetical protein